MEECACLCGVGSSPRCRCRQKRQRPAETAAAHGKPAPAPAEKQVEADAAVRCCAGSGGIESPMAPPHCSLQDLPVEMLVEIFASLPGTDLPRLALACTKFHHILQIDSIWRWRCREEPSLNTHEDGPLQFKPSFRIRLTERKSATVECMEGLHRRPHNHHMQIRKDRFSIQCNKTDHLTDSPTRLRGERGLVLVQEDRQVYDWLTYRRLYLPPRHPDDLIRPGLFQSKYQIFRLKKIAMLSFHGKYARVTKIMGESIAMLEIHLKRRIQLRDGEIFRNFNELSRVVQEIDEQVFREQQQQQEEDGTEESQGHGWQSPAQPSVGESGAAASEEQPVPFVPPANVLAIEQNYPRTCRMCFYGVDTVESIVDTVTKQCKNHDSLKQKEKTKTNIVIITYQY
ncbi:F-box only protein 31 [Myotis brandtii]|uniref:F-box only protein 31 n=1 Tax=Myotis brandtii TaxID=109478 RepID=S7MG74_MYOBR|nr:F-box only protein 31 [Myotis brandtii]